ncbi:MAG: efflux RND transporter periplasmic adaptor subunit [Cyclobacteriaceae bacterium]
MKKRQKIILAAGITIFAASIFISQLLARQSGKEASDNQAEGERTQRAKAVSTQEVKVGEVQSFIEFTGRLQAEDKIEIYAEVTGVLLPTPIDFKVGNSFPKGALLLRLDDSEASQNLRSARSRFVNTLASVVPDLEIDFPEASEVWSDYLLGLDVTEPLSDLPEPSSEQIRLFLSARDIYSQYYEIMQLEEQLNKYRLYAPFRGTLTQAGINKGTLVRSGQKVGEFIRSDVFELETAVSVSELSYFAIGDSVLMRSVNGQKVYEGQIARINEEVETNTQTIKVFVRVADPELKAGMYMEGKVKGRNFEEATELNRDILIEEEQVFVIQDSTAVLKDITMLKTSDTTAIVKGLEEGMKVITENNLASFEGSKVVPQDSNQQQL